jgi:hypothetical protein
VIDTTRCTGRLLLLYLQYRISQPGIGSKFRTIYWKLQSKVEHLLHIRNVRSSNADNKTGRLYNFPGLHPGLTGGTYKGDRNMKLPVYARTVCLDDTTELLAQESVHWPRYAPAFPPVRPPRFQTRLLLTTAPVPTWAKGFHMSERQHQIGIQSFHLRNFNPDYEYVENIQAEMLLIIIYRKCIPIIISIRSLYCKSIS